MDVVGAKTLCYAALCYDRAASLCMLLLPQKPSNVFVNTAGDWFLGALMTTGSSAALCFILYPGFFAVHAQGITVHAQSLVRRSGALPRQVHWPLLGCLSCSPCSDH